MTVKELREAISHYPDDTEVTIDLDAEGYFTLEDVSNEHEGLYCNLISSSEG